MNQILNVDDHIKIHLKGTKQAVLTIVNLTMHQQQAWNMKLNSEKSARILGAKTKTHRKKLNDFGRQ